MTDGTIPSPKPDTAQVVKLARLAILSTVGLALLLLIADFAGRGWSNPEMRFLSQKVLITVIAALVAEAAAGIAAATFLACRSHARQ
jgi:hypothetical protein